VLPVVRSGNTAKVVHRVCGSRNAEVHCTAAGKLLSAQSWAHAERKAAPVRFTAATITEESRLDRELANARATGMTTDVDEWRPGVTSLAIVVHGFATVRPTVLSAFGPTAGFGVRSSAPPLRRTAHPLALDLRGHPIRVVANL
jgi:DNA-binding IclR family transcriptional regulator